MRLRLPLAVLAALAASTAAAPPAVAKDEPIIIGHRGASGYLPEHTLPGYALAVKLGADYIEPDLVSTKNGRLIARHEPNITSTTDVAQHPEFADRKRKMMVDGVEEEGWFASDFTLAEIKTLRAIQPMGERPQQFNGLYKIPTFEQVIALAKRLSERHGRTVGITPRPSTRPTTATSGWRSRGRSSTLSKRRIGTGAGPPSSSRASSSATSCASTG